MRATLLTTGAALGIICMLTAGAAGAQDAQTGPVIWNGAPEFRHGEFRFKPRGRILLDYVAQEVDRAAGPDLDASESRIRTARLGVEGRFSSRWSYVAEVAIHGGEANWEDLFLTYAPTANSSIRVGNFKTVSLENVTSGRFITFMERGPFNDLIDGSRVMGLAASVNGEAWSLTGGVHGDSINDGAVGGHEQAAAYVRGHVAPVLTDEMQLHLGAWARVRDRRDDTPFRYRVRNNTNFGDRYTDAGSSPLGAGDRDTAIGLEAAGVWRSFSVQGEWTNIDAQLTGGGDADARAYYVFASFFPTGEQRRYRPTSGRFDRVSIRNPLDGGGFGAIELAARYDNADLTAFAGVPAAGEYSAVTLGATWYPVSHVRFMANYTDSRNTAQIPGADVDVKTFQIRAQFDF